MLYYRTTDTITALARARGSTATTRGGAWRYLLSHLPAARRGYIPSRWERGAASKANECRARDERRAERIMAALGLPDYDRAADERRVRKIEAAKRRQARAAQVRADLESDEERALRAAGYTLVREGTHRVLAGLDDGHPFSVRIPLHRRTIGEALAWLRPQDVPAAAPRQGEWYFVRRDPEPAGETYSPAGSRRTINYISTDTFDHHRRHMPSQCLAVIADGATCFIGRKKIKRHEWTGRTRIYVRGTITHPEHGMLSLPEGWHEVIPNRAHGPFGVGAFAGGLD